METLRAHEGPRSVSFQLPGEGRAASAFENKPLCVPRQLAELLQKVEEGAPT